MFVLARALTYSTLFVAFVLVFLPGRVLEWSGIAAPPAWSAWQLVGVVVTLTGRRELTFGYAPSALQVQNFPWTGASR